MTSVFSGFGTDCRRDTERVVVFRCSGGRHGHPRMSEAAQDDGGSETRTRTHWTCRRTLRSTRLRWRVSMFFFRHNYRHNYFHCVLCVRVWLYIDSYPAFRRALSSHCHIYFALLFPQLLSHILTDIVMHSQLYYCRLGTRTFIVLYCVGVCAAHPWCMYEDSYNKDRCGNVGTLKSLKEGTVQTLGLQTERNRDQRRLPLGMVD